MLENARQEIAALTEEKKLFIMGLNNTLANMRVSSSDRRPPKLFTKCYVRSEIEV